MDARTNRRRRIEGFTLVELLIVITLIGVGVGLAVQSFRSFRDGRRAQEGARVVQMVFQAARERAASTNQWIGIDFSPGGFTTSAGFMVVYADLDRDGTFDAGEDTAVNLPNRESRGGLLGFGLGGGTKFDQSSGAVGPLGQTMAADGVTFSQDRLTFLPDGTASESGAVAVVDPGGREYAVSVTVGGSTGIYAWANGSWK